MDLTPTSLWSPEVVLELPVGTLAEILAHLLQAVALTLLQEVHGVRCPSLLGRLVHMDLSSHPKLLQLGVEQAFQTTGNSRNKQLSMGGQRASLCLGKNPQILNIYIRMLLISMTMNPHGKTCRIPC